MQTPAHDHSYENQSIALIGYGVTGKASAKFLLNKGAIVSVFDKSFVGENTDAAALHLKNKDAGKHNYDHKLSFHHLSETVDLTRFDTLVVSPGVNLQQGFIQRYLVNKPENRAKVIGDIELFARELAIQNEAKSDSHKTIKVVAVTGSNGKSTVVDMLYKSLTHSGLKVALGGNFGTCALSLLSELVDVIILELSSFQLESTFSLRPDIACILNVTSDHLDRHGDIRTYAEIKHRIFVNAKHIIFNRDDTLSYPNDLSCSYSIGVNAPLEANPEQYLYQTHEGIFLNHGLLVSLDKLNISSQFQLLNMQAVLACAYILKAKMAAVIESLGAYKGLPHRFEITYQSNNATWINDSKATNPGACLAAIESASRQFDHIVLIAGGDAKGADASILSTAIQNHVDHMLLIGKDAALFTQFNVPYEYVNSLEDAVVRANEFIQSTLHTKDKVTDSIKTNIAVLLSPACASIDMFNNYQQRGDIFSQAVHKQVAV